MDWLKTWRRYEVKVWRDAWQRTEAAGKKVLSTGMGLVVSLVIAVIVLGAALELKSFLPLLTALILFLAALWLNLFLAPSRLDRDAQEVVAAERRTAENLRGQLERKRIEQQTYEALRSLHQEGEALLIRFGKPAMDEWCERVAKWRTTVYDKLPFERDGFLSMSSPQVWEAAPHGEPRRDLFISQLAKFRAILMRLENEVDGWEPGKR
jgi:hypothetical protein